MKTTMEHPSLEGFVHTVCTDIGYRWTTYALAALVATPVFVLLDMTGVRDTVIVGVMMVGVPFIAVGSYVARFRTATHPVAGDERHPAPVPVKPNRGATAHSQKPASR